MNFISNKEIENASLQQSRKPYLEAGQFDLEVTRVVAGVSRKDSQPYVAIEFKVLASTNTQQSAGTEVSLYVGFKYRESAINQLLTLLVRGFGITEAQAKKEIADQSLWSDTQLLAGEKVRIVVRDGTSSTGKPKKFYDFSILD